MPAGTGSGFLWDQFGHVVTNYHVVAGASSLVVTLADKRQFEAEIVGTDPSTDLSRQIESLRELKADTERVG